MPVEDLVMLQSLKEKNINLNTHWPEEDTEGLSESLATAHRFTCCQTSERF
jgi:hypothetical protein